MRQASLILCLFVACIIVITLYAATISPTPSSSAPTPIVAPVTMEQDMQRIAVSRPAGNNTFVSSNIAAELRKCGLPVFKQRFPQGMNIVATQKGTTTNTIIVGSHYDSMPRTPGADDNGSGVVVNLAVARNLSKRKFTNTITYIFFDAEEGGLIGSAYYANNMKEKCIFMVNLDMVGHLKLTTVATTSGVPDALFKKYPWAKAVSFQTMGSPSDQTSFQRLGIPALWVFTGTHSHYHQPSDTPATLNFNGMRLIKNYVEDVVLSFDKKVDTQFIQSLNVSNDTL